MHFEPGTRVGPYEIVSAAGFGGMGAVYRARDTRLDRIVAIKVLSDLSRSPDLAQRFEREARAVAALNHPHICTLHDVGRHEEVDYLVMEYIEGETLAARLERGALPMDDVARLGVQMAEALDAAHRQGIVHRDLKPSNVMLTASGVKLLDFGLAKFRDIPDNAVSSAPLSVLATTDRSLTMQGTVLGTLQYMAPEQVEGKDADRRTDIFALGCVLYEMATGRRAFDGRSHVSLMAAILEKEPDAIAAVRSVSPRFDYVVRTCLAKDPEDRWQSAREVARELRAALAEPMEPPAAAATHRASRAWRWIAAALVIAALAAASAAAWVLSARPSSPVTVRRFEITIPSIAGNVPQISISPDGQKLAFVAASSDSANPVLWLRAMDSLTPIELPSTEGANFPFWSPDSRFVGFFANGRLKKIDTLGGVAQTLSAAASPVGGTWGHDGTIVFSDRDILYRVPSAGGDPVRITGQDDMSGADAAYRWPSFLPGQRRVLATSGLEASTRKIVVAAVDGARPIDVVKAPSMALYAQPGFLLYHRDTTVFAQPFDSDRGIVTGDAFPIAEQIGFSAGGRAAFSVAQDGTLAYVTGGPAGQRGQLAWFDRTGKELGKVGGPDFYQQMRLSPDERRVVYSRIASGAAPDLWLLEVSSGIASRFTTDSRVENDPVWSPDGSRIVFFAERGAGRNIYVKVVGGLGEEPLYLSDENVYVESWSDDGRTIVYRDPDRNSINALSLDAQPTTRRLFETPFTKEEVQLSPDGRWIAWNGNDSGRMEVYVASFPEFTHRRQLSSEGGVQPRWRTDGRELFYLSLDGKLMVVDIRADSTIESSVPRFLFQTRINPAANLGQYSVTRDGKRFLMLDPLAAAGARAITVVLNWPAGIQ